VLVSGRPGSTHQTRDPVILLGQLPVGFYNYIHHPAPQLEISYKNSKVNAFIRSGWLFLCGKPIGKRYIKHPCHDNLPAATHFEREGKEEEEEVIL
jgi:hypothetical protein